MSCFKLKLLNKCYNSLSQGRGFFRQMLNRHGPIGPVQWRADQELPVGPRYETLLPAASQTEPDAHLALRVIPIETNIDNKVQLKLLRLTSLTVTYQTKNYNTTISLYFVTTNPDSSGY